MLRSLLLIVFLAFSAAASAEDFDYNWLSFGYSMIDFDDINVDGDALVGYNTALSNVVDAWARLSYKYEEFDGPGAGSNDDNGFGFGVGMRFAATEQVELEGAIQYVDLNDRGDDTALVLGGLYSFTPAFAVGLFGEWGDDVTTYSLLGRFYWGQ